ncbi:hypothetical protein M8J75_004109 [Diaphorina citri]|nr:hypothetical protein M8J75_004109 [Diaphorina citri]
MTRISRLDMGAYLCIASNNVPPTVSKRIKVSVDYMGAYLCIASNNVPPTVSKRIKVSVDCKYIQSINQ